MKCFFLKGLSEQGNRLKKSPGSEKSWRIYISTWYMSGKKGRGQEWLAEQTARKTSRISH